MSILDGTPNSDYRDLFRIPPENAAKANEEMQIDAVELEANARNYLDLFFANFAKFRERNPSLVPEVACLVAAEGEIRRLRNNGMPFERIATMAMHCLATMAEEIRTADAEERRLQAQKPGKPGNPESPDTDPKENPNH